MEITFHGSIWSLKHKGFIKFLCRRSGFFSRAFLVSLMKESKKRRGKQPGTLMAKSRSQPVKFAWCPALNEPPRNMSGSLKEWEIYENVCTMEAFLQFCKSPKRSQVFQWFNRNMARMYFYLQKYITWHLLAHVLTVFFQVIFRLWSSDWRKIYWHVYRICQLIVLEVFCGLVL